MAIKVKLRQKKISGGKISLYLDFYPAIPHPVTGVLTRREFLGRYILEKPKTILDKQHKKETLQQAEQIRQKKELELNKPEIYSDQEKEKLRIKEKGDQDFIRYIRELIGRHKDSTRSNWICALKYFESYTGGACKFSELNERLCDDFRDFLLKSKSKRSESVTLAQNSAQAYFSKFVAALSQAHKDGFIPLPLHTRIGKIKRSETKRSFLTLDELNRLAKTECRDPLMKRAALFSALTGLRFSDIQKLTWGEIEHVKGQGYFLHFRQQKTKRVESLPISDQAYKLMGERRQPSDQVFTGLNYSAYYNKHLYQWIGSAGISKNITFHSFRHTYATLQLSHGTDIYTVSKLLGHRELKTTQIYAKVLDKAKMDAANRIKLDL